MKYTIHAWYRQNDNKDYDFFEIEANSKEEALEQIPNRQFYFNFNVKDEIQIEKEKFYKWMEEIKSIHLANNERMMEAFEKIEQFKNK